MIQADPTRGRATAVAGTSLAEVCWRRRGTLAATLALALVAGIVYLRVAPRLYTSTAKVLVQQNGMRLLTGKGDEANGRSSDGYLYQQLEIIRAEPILAQAVDACPAEAVDVFPLSANRVVDLQNKIGVNIGKRDEVISVSLESEKPESAAKLVNAVVAAYEAFQSQSMQSSAADAMKILRREKEKQDAVLSDKLKEIVAFKQLNAELFFTTEGGTNILMKNLAMLSEQATQARLKADVARAQVAEVSNRLQAERVARQYEAQAKAAEAFYDREKGKASKVNAAQAEYQKLQVEADRTTKLCDALDARIKELDVTAYSGGMNVRVLEHAAPEARATWPKKSTVLLAAAAAGLALGCGLGVVREWLDRRLHSPEQVAKLLGLPVLAAVPDASDAIGGIVTAEADDELSEAFHGLAATLWFADASRASRSVLVTSPERRDGASLTTFSLGFAAAGAGRRTLIVDANVRRPAQHDLHGVANPVGLSDVVGRGVRVEQAIRPTDQPNLWLLPAGTVTAKPGEIASSQAFGQLLQKLEADFDLIVIDGPAVLASPDARLFGAQADLTLLVLHARRSTQQAAVDACERLRGVGANVVGVVLNHVAPRRRRAASRRGSGATRPAWDLASGRPGDEAAGHDNGASVAHNGTRILT